MRHTVRCCLIVGKTSYLCCFLDPCIVVTVAVEEDSLVILDCLLDHVVKSCLEIFSAFKSVSIDLQRLCNSCVEHHVSAGDAVGRTKASELELVACESKR